MYSWIMNREIYTPPGGPPPGGMLSPEIYQRMGESNIYLMLRDFYRELAKSPIQHLFPEDMDAASEKTAAFFVFLLGGPPQYQERYGSPMMRKRHMAFVIDEEAKQAWLNCFKTVLKDAETKYSFPKEHLNPFWHFLERFADWMVNTKK